MRPLPSAVGLLPFLKVSNQEAWVRGCRLGYEVAGSDGGSEGSVVGSRYSNQQRSIWNDTWRLLVGGSSCKRLAYEECNPKPIIDNNEAAGYAKKTKIPLVLGL
ncbi:hypothetical protein Tco_0347281 [Tanacetum coccineum]